MKSEQSYYFTDGRLLKEGYSILFYILTVLVQESLSQGKYTVSLVNVQ